jgi:hypothetical protein
MPNPGSLGSIVPQDDPGALTRRVAELEKLVQQMSTASSLAYATIDRGGVTVTNGGSLQVVDTDGHVVAYVGALPSPFNRSDGSAQPGMALYREDGSLAALLGDANPLTLPYKQSFQIVDRANRIVVADDTNGGKGLAVPWVGGGLIMGDTNVSKWPQTTSSSFLSVSFGYYRIQNPRVQWDIQYVADSATAGQVRLMVNGIQVDTTQTVGTAFGLWTRYMVAIPGTWNVGDIVGVDLQARRTSGTGIVYAQSMRFSGDQSP